MFAKPLAGCYACLLTLLISPLFLTVPVALQMTGISTIIIIISSVNAARREAERKANGDSASERDVIGRDQAKRFPLVASFALFGMFLAFKYLPKEWVSFLLTLYGVSFGGLALSGVLGSLLERVPNLPAVFTKEIGNKNVFSFTLCDVVGIFPAAPVAYWYYTTKAWIPNNLLACALALSAIDLLAIPDFQSAAILLSGLFIYDIFWVFGSKSVFGSNVMVSVAKQFEGPVKLVFPRFVGAGARDMSMLGLGDIVIPGLFVALMLRFDVRKHDLTKSMPTRLPYFVGAVIAYVLGLAATYVALTVFEAAQPALLYLVPSCLFTALGTAVVKKEFTELNSYTEEDASEKKGKEAEKSGKPDGEESVQTEESTQDKKDQ